MIDDYFAQYFDMNKYPSDLRSEEGIRKRELMSNFFYKFKEFYDLEIREKGLNPLFFVMNKPHNMLYGNYNGIFYFVLSTDNALMGRTGLYSLKDDTFLDITLLSQYATSCGFGENTIIVDVPKPLIDDPGSDDSVLRIEKEARGFVSYEIEMMERKNSMIRIKPFFGEIEYKVNPKKVFMLMPFSDQSLNEFYQDHIKPSIEDVDMNCLRADDIFNNKSIIEDIWRNINEARIIIADLTHRNPNVFYEVGIAHTLGKEVILISQEENDIPFDLRHIRTIFYRNTTRGAQQFIEQLKETIKGITEFGEIQDS